MKQIIYKSVISLIVLGLGLLIYLNMNKNEKPTDVLIHVQLEIYDEKLLIYSETLEAYENESVAIFLKRYFTLKGNNYGFGYFLTGLSNEDINLEKSDLTYFAFYVDDSYQKQGISQTFLKDGIKISLKLETLR